MANIPRPPSSFSTLSENSVESQKSLPETPYHVFGNGKKRIIVYFVSFLAMFSPLSSNIYFPALDAIATDLHVSIEQVTLSITIFMIFQGIMPSIWGPISDVKGRRITLMGTFLTLAAANFGLLVSRSYAGLMLFRALQAAGSASTIALGTAVISDICTSVERGGYNGINQSFRQSAQAFGPVLGGLLTQGFGFRSIFALLLALTAVALLGVIVFLPETHRDIAGDGTIRLSGINKPAIYYIKKQTEAYYPPQDGIKPRKRLTLQAFTSPLKWLLEKDVICLLGLGAIVYTVQSMMTASTTNLFETRYHLNELQLGLIFIPNGIGNVVGSIVNGRLLDRDMQRAEADYRRAKKIPDKQQLKPKQCPDFPLERARLAKIPILVGSFVTFTAGYGVSYLSEPADTDDLITQLVMQFFMAATSAAVLNTNQTSMTDLFPGNSASAVALNNLVRCSLGAVGVGVVDRLIAAVGPMPTFVGAAVVALLATPLTLINSRWGMKWRLERQKRQAMQEERDNSSSETAIMPENVELKEISTAVVRGV